jgi:hypothetical protein
MEALKSASLPAMPASESDWLFSAYSARLMACDIEEVYHEGCWPLCIGSSRSLYWSHCGASAAGLGSGTHLNRKALMLRDVFLEHTRDPDRPVGLRPDDPFELFDLFIHVVF